MFLASPSRTTLSIGLAVFVMLGGRREKSSFEMKLLPCAPVSSRPLSKFIMSDLSGQ